MFTFFYFTSCSILLLVAELLLRSAGLTVPLLGFFFAAASVAVSSRMAFFFALVFGVALDFTAGYAAPWSGLLLPLLTLPAIFLSRKRPFPVALEFLAGAAIPPVMAVPHLLSVLTTPEGFGSLLASCLLGAVLLPAMLALVARSAYRLKIGADAERGDV